MTTVNRTGSSPAWLQTGGVSKLDATPLGNMKGNSPVTGDRVLNARDAAKELFSKAVEASGGNYAALMSIDDRNNDR